MDRDSDNFTAELLLKELGAEVGAGGTTAAGAAVVLRDLAAAGVPLTGVRIVDGSGLSLDDRLTARALASLLVGRLEQPRAAAAVLGGAAGRRRSTARSRTGMERAPARGVVRAKTGTTNRASALSGYVARPLRLRRSSRTAPRCSTWAARKAQDRFATALARAQRSSSATQLGLAEQRHAGLLGLRHLRARALADEHAGRLLRDVVGDLRAERLERGASPPRATSTRACPVITYCVAGQRAFDGTVLLARLEAQPERAQLGDEPSRCRRRRTTRRSPRRARGRCPRTP